MVILLDLTQSLGLTFKKSTSHQPYHQEGIHTPLESNLPHLKRAIFLAKGIFWSQVDLIHENLYYVIYCHGELGINI